MKCIGLFSSLILAVVVIGSKQKTPESAANDAGASDYFDARMCDYYPSCQDEIQKEYFSSNPGSTAGLWGHALHFNEVPVRPILKKNATSPSRCSSIECTT